MTGRALIAVAVSGEPQRASGRRGGDMRQVAPHHLLDGLDALGGVEH